MKSVRTERFRKAFADLPEHVQQQARKAYHQFQADPTHPSLQFKQVHATRPIYAARVSLGYRALAVRDERELRPVKQADALKLGLLDLNVTVLGKAGNTAANVR